MKDTYYFSHDSNARNDEKILMLRAEHGWEGYGIYWLLIEMMFESAETCLYHNKLKGIAVANNIDITLLKSVITTCVDEKLFTSDNEVFYSDSLSRRKQNMLNLRKKKSEAGKKGMAKRWEQDNTDITQLKHSNNTVITKDNKGKESIVKESKVNTKEKQVKEDLLVNYSQDFKDAFKDFKEMRTKVKAANTDRALKMILNELNKLSTNESTQIDILNQSTMNSWKGVFPIKQDFKKGKKEIPNDIKVDWLEQFEKDNGLK